MTCISDLPRGYDTFVGERGIRLSGGQRQRIGIARALYHDPDILVLDEATSSLDKENEQAIIQAIQTLRGIKTIIVVAHRLTTVIDCNYIYRFEKGLLIDKGSASRVLEQIV